MNKQLTSFDKIQRAMFSEPDSAERSLPASLEKIKERYMKCFTYWLHNPSYSDKQVVRFLTNECSVNRAQAYLDLKYVKILLGNVSNASREWMLYTVIEMCKEAYNLAKLKGDAKGMAIAADKIGKYSKLDKTEVDQLPWDQIIPPNFEPSPDISVLGFKPDPNIEDRRRKLRNKYLKQFDPNAVQEAEIVD